MPKHLSAAGLVILTLFIVFGLVSYQAKSKIQELEKSKDRGTLSWHAAVAKAKGQREVAIPGPIVTYGVPSSFDEALAYYSLVIVEPLERRSFAKNEEIRSWYRFRLIEELSTPTIKCITCPEFESAPSDMLPLAPSEFLVSKSEGEIEIDGVRLVSTSRNFPPFEIGKRYLLFLSYDDQKTVAALRMGPWGAFGIEAEQLKAVNEEYKHVVIDELTAGPDRSINKLRTRLNKTKN